MHKEAIREYLLVPKPLDAMVGKIVKRGRYHEAVDEARDLLKKNSKYRYITIRRHDVVGDITRED